MDTLAQHLLVELHGCDRAVLNDSARLRIIMLSAATAAGASVVAEVFHAYSPHGVTCLLAIEESHFSLHTWPEHGYAAADLYTCGKLPVERALAVLCEGLRAERHDALTVERGRRELPPFRVREGN
jgi:S-adenosylmethionine decarboxylase